MAWWVLEKPLSAPPEKMVQRRSRLAVNEKDAAVRPEDHVPKLLNARAELLRQSGWPGPSRTPLLPGRFLLVVKSYNLMDGAACVASSEFFGGHNLPHCDLWVDFIEEVALHNDSRHPVLLSWIPEEFSLLAQQGIDENFEASIGWVEVLAPQLHEELTALVRS
ncbi:hypothetical protein [Chondromyces crocatus]|uniref:hypothetical protein n=1 Tax=Chondromyces crocatus TaxID=52 RepID=UPI0012E2EAE8|nr:hypothetical protein [Chondromyces crocatus]